MSGKGGHRGGHGNRGGNWGSHGATYSYGAHNAAHNPFEVKLPRFLNWLEYNEADQSENSLIMVDDRDVRMVSPFQCWLTREIMANSASSINVLTERDQVMPPNSGFHLSLFGNYTLDGIKAVIVIALDTETGAPNGWDRHTATALSHPAFQPFSWPMLRDTSASYTDVKVYNGNEILFHWIFRGYRADTDLTVQQQFVDEVLLRQCNRGKPRLSVVVAAFVGWRVTVFSFECGGRTYSVGPNGAVVAGDRARSRFELRVCNRSSQDAMGNDADRVEFRFRDANNRLDLKCQRTSVPGTWLTVSHISGPTLIQTIQNVRQARARVEGPEHTEQFGQLAAVHEHWFNWAVAENAEDVGCLVDFIGDLDDGNFHITATSKLWTRAPEIVNPKAIAETQRQEAGLAAPFGPPAITEGTWRHVTERVVASSSADEPVVSTSAQADFELASRSFNAPPSRSTDHIEDEARDHARNDRRYARSSAQVTPAVFASQIRSKVSNETSATIEEVDDLPPQDLELPSAAREGRPTDAAGLGSGGQGDPDQTPASAPSSLGPGASSLIDEDRSI
ncbi:Uncharacterized protein SCF082_LOCUS43739 [Durusdinium trenchii]|uniref:Uncharacterized protein n=1 Tax=Durusdinium trenchii TaxID=1381693 RepID=A0ABP0R1A5_9DINO